ncbi:MAG: PAS domain-containing protein [Ginsengibacter sp.]
MIDQASLLKIFKASPVPTVILLPDDPHFTIVDASDSFIKQTKNCSRKIQGLSIFRMDCIQPEQIQSLLQNVLKSAEPQIWESDKQAGELIPIFSGTGSIDYIIYTVKNGIPGIPPSIKRLPQLKKPAVSIPGAYKDVLSLSPVPVIIYDLETFEILDANELTLHQYGYGRKEFLKMKLNDLWKQDEPDLFELHQKNSEIKGNADFGIFIHHKKDGTPIYIQFSGNAVSISGKDCMLAVCLDVSKRQNMLLLLEDIQEKLNAAQNIAKIGYWKLSLRTGQLFWSDQVYTILSLEKDECKLELPTFFEKIHPDDIEVFSKEREVALEAKGDLDIDFRIINNDGTVKWVHEKGKVIKNEAGEAVTFEGTIQDITESKLLKLSLEQSNQRYQFVTRATFDAIWDWDLVADKSYWGEGFERTFGYNLKEINADPEFWSRHIHPDDFDDIMTGIQKSIMSTATNWHNEYRFQKADGSYAYVMDKCIIIRNDEGKAVRLVGAMQDITEKRTLQQLLDKANRLAKIGSWEIDVPSATVYWSDITKEIRETPPGYQPSLKDGIGHFKEGYSRDTIIARVKESIHFGSSWQEDLQIYTHKGNLKWIRTTGKAELKDGKCVKIYGSFQDIDETKKAELEILKLYEEKNTILESIGDGFFTVDKNWMVTYWNQEAERMLETPKNLILGKNLWNVFSDSIDSHSYKKYHEAFETGERIFFEDYYPALDKWFEISAYPSTSGLSVYFKDITDRILAQIELNELNQNLQKTANDLAVSNAELEQFAYIASHDLQEPLRMITSFLAQIEKKYNDLLDEKGKQYIHFAVDGARRMRQIILDLLEFSRVGRFDGSIEEVDVTELAEEVMEVYEKQIEETGAIIQFQNLPVVKAYKSPLRQVFQNLVGNALKYQEPDAKPLIKIESEELPGHWKFRVKDNGIGIEPDYYDKVFNIFQRLHNKEEYSGTGIGLSIVKKIVEAMGGKIGIEPNEPKGSIFIFTISK